MGVMLSLAAQGSVQLKQYGSTDAVQVRLAGFLPVASNS